MTVSIEFLLHLPDSYRFNFLVIRYDRRSIPFGVNIRRAGAQSLHKGMRVIAQGRLQQRTYQAKDGQPRTGGVCAGGLPIGGHYQPAARRRLLPDLNDRRR